MCVTTVSSYCVCLHEHKYTAKCKKQTAPFILAQFLACKPSTDITFNYNICHDCRRTYANAGIDEQTAIERYVDFRKEHNYHAPLSAVLQHTLGMAPTVTLVRDCNDFTEAELMQDKAARELGSRLTGTIADRVDEQKRRERELMEFIRGMDKDERIIPMRETYIDSDSVFFPEIGRWVTTPGFHAGEPLMSGGLGVTDEYGWEAQELYGGSPGNLSWARKSVDLNKPLPQLPNESLYELQ